MNQTPKPIKPAPFLAVDLDGTLVHTDLLIESIFALLKVNVLYLFLLPIWLLKGKANLKAKIASRADINIELLPYNKALLEYLSAERNNGKQLILATASHEKYAKKIAAFLGLFDVVLATSDTHNLVGEQKRQALIKHCGEGQFDYAGNAIPDLKIWSHSQQAIIVSNHQSLINKASQVTQLGPVFRARGGGIKPYLKQLRVHQWLKNMLVFIPLLTSHQLFNNAALTNTLLAFIAFGLCASSVYVLNDALDLEADRQHRTKYLRPLAHGDIPGAMALILIPVMLILGFSIAAFVNIEFVGALFLYYSLTVFYSIKLKSMVLLDVVALAALYTSRIIAGGVAASIDLSFWLLAFSMFMFFSLALVKRVSELLELSENGQTRWMTGRGYQTNDLDTLHTLGISSGYASIFVVAMYINSPEIVNLYSHPQVIWLICPVLLYWVSRVWIMVHRGQMHSDPLIFAITDRVSHLSLILCGLILFIAK